MSTHDLSVHTLIGLAFYRGQSHDKRFNTEDHHFFMCRQVTSQREDCKNGCLVIVSNGRHWAFTCGAIAGLAFSVPNVWITWNNQHVTWTQFHLRRDRKTLHDLLTICFTWSLTCSSNVSHLCWCCILMVGSFEVSAFLSCKPAAILATWDLPPSANSFTKATKNWG